MSNNKTKTFLTTIEAPIKHTCSKAFYVNTDKIKCCSCMPDAVGELS